MNFFQKLPTRKPGSGRKFKITARETRRVFSGRFSVSRLCQADFGRTSLVAPSAVNERRGGSK